MNVSLGGYSKEIYRLGIVTLFLHFFIQYFIDVIWCEMMMEEPLPPDFLIQLENALRLAGQGSAWLTLEPIDEELGQIISDTLSDYVISTDTRRTFQRPPSPPPVQTKRPWTVQKAQPAPKPDISPNDTAKAKEPPQPTIEGQPDHPDFSIDKAANLDSLRFRTRDCQNCGLYLGRKTVVFGQGNQKAKLMFIGDFPENEDDRKGIAFIGSAGKLLTQIIQSIGLNRDSVYLTTVLKCFSPNDFKPSKKEVRACFPILEKQIDLLKPDIIVTLGNLATKALIADAKGISEMRGQVFSYRGIPVVPTYHPAYLFKKFSASNKLWDDMRRIRQLLFKSINS